MATAAELLAGVSTGDDTTLVIDNYLRTIHIPKRITNLGVEHDDDVLTLDFKMPRYLDDTDLSKFSIRINYINANGDSDAYIVTDDKKVITTDHILFSWLVGPTATAYKGNTKFIVCMKVLDSEGYIDKEYNTTVATLPVLEGLEVDESVVTRYSDLIEQWYQTLFDNTQAKIDEIWTASQNAYEAFQESIDEYVEQNVAKDWITTSKTAEEGIRTKADAIISTAEGRSITVFDSSDDCLRGLRIFGKSIQTTTTGKNLFKNGFALGHTETVKGVTFTVNADGSIRAKGTPTASIAYNIFEGEVLPIGNYYISGAPASASQKFRLQVNLNESGTERTGGVDMGSGAKFSVDASVTSLRGYIYVASDAGSVEGIFYPQIELGTVATPYEPYTNGKPSPDPDCPQEITSVENPEIHIFGKNILKFDHADNYLPTSVTLIEEFESGAILKGSDGAVPGGSTYSSGWYQVCYNNRIPLKAGTYVTLSADYTVLENPHSTTANISMHFSAKDSYSLTGSILRPADGVKTRISRTVLIEKDDEYFFTIGLNSCTVRIENIQLELSDKMTGYEPYIDRQNIILTGTLSGVPVSSGGNYTDSNGKQWFCDEIDFERGVYIQRTIKKTFSASVNEAWRVYNVHSERTHTAYQESKLCGDMQVFPGTASDVAALISNEYVALPLTEVYNNGTQGISVSNVSPAIRMCVDACQGYSIDEFKAWLKEHPFELVYPLTTPIETPLTTEELEAFKALKTNYPRTTVQNDSGAHMELKYNADTKTYVDNGIKQTVAEVMEAIANGSY